MSEVTDKCVIVYDGTCAYCRKQIERIKSRDRLHHFTYVPAQDENLGERFPQLLEHDLDTGLRLIEPDGLVHVGADSIYQVAKRLPAYRRLAWLYRIWPVGLIGRWIYGRIARRRHQLASSCDICGPTECDK